MISSSFIDFNSKSLLTPVLKNRFKKLSLKKDVQSYPQKDRPSKKLVGCSDTELITDKNLEYNKRNRSRSKSLSPVKSVGFCSASPLFVTKSRPIYSKNLSSSLILFDSDDSLQVNNNHNENSKLSCNLEVQTNSISEQISISKLSNNLNEIITVETNFNDAINKSTSNDCLESTKPLKYNNDDYLTPPQNRIINNLSPISTRIMNNLYGEIWITTPGLLKKTSRKLAIDENKKHLDFDEEDLNEKLTKLNISNNRDKDFEPLFNYESDSEGNKASNEGSPDVIKFVKKHTRKIISSSSDSSEDECEKLKNNIRAEIDNDYQIPKAKTILTYDLTSTSRPPAITNEKKIKKQFKPKTLGNIGKVSVINNQEDTDLDQKNNQYYSFMASLADNIPPWQCHPKAKFYKENFKSKKEELTRALFKLYNKHVFEYKLDHDLVITWNTNLTKTAGRAHNKMVRNATKTRESRVELSCKVLDNAYKLRQTLAHELCHVATWLIDGQLHDGHGSYWKSWVKKVLKRFPEHGSITRCHSYDIKYKYSYICMKCGYSVGRHSKSIDIDRKRCGYCYGKFELKHNKIQKDGLVVSTPIKQRKPATGFALFVKENYGNVRSSNTPHKETMKYLSKQYNIAKQKLGSSDDND